MFREETQNPWFFPLTPPRREKKFRLFMFHYAGGSVSAFRSWAKDLAAPIEVIGIQLPGRETRFAEPLIYDLPNVIKSLIEVLPVYFNKPFIFFGHSLGSIISFEITRALREKKYPTPRHLIISGTEAPHSRRLRPKIYNLPDTEFIAKLSLYNGIPSILREEPELLNLFLPMIRADFTISETYVYKELPPLPCSISAFSGLQDPFVTQEEIFSWESHTSKQFKYYFFEGDHFFFMRESYTKVITAVDKILFNEILKFSF